MSSIKIKVSQKGNKTLTESFKSFKVLKYSTKQRENTDTL